MMSGSVNAQLLRTEELYKYSMDKYGDKWDEAAENLAKELCLDQNNGISYVQVIEAPGVTADKLYVLLNYWFTATFNDGNSVLQLNDKDLGTIIAQGYMPDIAEHTGGSNAYRISIRPIIKCDIKDGRVRVTYTVPYYITTKIIGGGSLVQALGGGRVGTTTTEGNEAIDQCFPFIEKDKHKKTSCKAFIMANAYSNVVMDKIESCVKQGLVGNENDDW